MRWITSLDAELAGQDGLTGGHFATFPISLAAQGVQADPLGGMVVPIAIYLAINAGRSSAPGWGAAMSTDTAFALGALALVGPGVPDRVRTYLLTFALADDVAGIAVIALAYSGKVTPMTACGRGSEG